MLPSLNWKVLILLSVIATCMTAPSYCFDDQEFERRRAEHNRKMEEFDRKFEKRRSTSNSSHRRSSSNSGNSQSSPFDSKNAPSADKCFLKFLQTLKSATSMEQVLPYYSTVMRESLEHRQAGYDPSEEKRKKELFQKSYEEHKGSPYESSLRQMKRIATATRKVDKVTYVGDKKAYVIVSTTKGRGRCEMVGEGRYWYYNAYKDDPIIWTRPMK